MISTTKKYALEIEIFTLISGSQGQISRSGEQKRRFQRSECGPSGRPTFSTESAESRLRISSLFLNTHRTVIATTTVIFDSKGGRVCANYSLCNTSNQSVWVRLTLDNTDCLGGGNKGCRNTAPTKLKSRPSGLLLPVVPDPDGVSGHNCDSFYSLVLGVCGVSLRVATDFRFVTEHKCRGPPWQYLFLRVNVTGFRELKLSQKVGGLPSNLLHARAAASFSVSTSVPPPYSRSPHDGIHPGLC